LASISLRRNCKRGPIKKTDKTTRGGRRRRGTFPPKAVQDLTAKKTAAENLFAQDTSTDRTKTITAQCKAAFADLEAFMRDFKRRYFLVPPLVDVCWRLRPPIDNRQGLLYRIT
jgi:hypothetical protein